MTILHIILLCIAICSTIFILFLILPLPFPLPTQSDWEFRCSPWFQLYYSNKYLHPVKHAARGSGLKNYFAHLNFTFDKPSVPFQTITISATGDLMTRPDLDVATAQHLWDDIGPLLFSSDISIGNLECAVNPDHRIQKTLRFSVSHEQAQPLLGDKQFGFFDVVSIANNHINDSGTQGINATKVFLKQNGIAHVGTDSSPYTLIKRGGATIAVCGYTFGTNGITLEDPHSVNRVRFNALDDADYNPSLIHKHIQQAKHAGAQYIVLLCHWGIEWEYYPPPRLVKRAHDLLDAGADCIFGHHPHIVNPIDRYTTVDGRDGFVFYSLGNLTRWAMFHPMQVLSHIAKLTLAVFNDANGSVQVRPLGVAMTPTYHIIGHNKGKPNHRIGDACKAMMDTKEQVVKSSMLIMTRSKIKYALKEYARVFRQQGIEYPEGL